VKILYVEDDVAAIAYLREALPNATILTAESRDEAFRLIDEEFFDMAVCDLQIPSSKGFESAVRHGSAVVTRLAELLPGVPIVTFSSFETSEFLRELQSLGRREDYLGIGDEEAMVRSFDKGKFEVLVGFLSTREVELNNLDGIDVKYGINPRNLSAEAERIVRIYTRQKGCVIGSPKVLGGGHSGASIVRIDLTRSEGSSGGTVVARIDTVQAIENEHALVQRYVAGTLPLGSFASVIKVICAGAGKMGAIIYQVAPDARPFWNLPLEDDSFSAAAVESIRDSLAIWSHDSPTEHWKIADIRRVLISDERWHERALRCGLSDGQVDLIEAKSAYILRGTIHADLHCGNVLYGTSPILIDFESVRIGPCSLDPVALELSYLFHPDSPIVDSDWPSVEQIESWDDLPIFLQNCPFPQYITACRSWSTSVAKSDLDLYASVYAYLAQQSKFESSNEDRLRAMMRMVLRHISI